MPQSSSKEITMARRTWIEFLSLSLSVILLAAVVCSAKAQAGGQSPSVPNGQAVTPHGTPPQPPKTLPAGDQMTNIPYFTLRDGMNSTLTLNNTAASPIPVTVTIYNMQGRSQVLPPITLDPHSFKQIELGDVVASELFDSGNLQVSYGGTPMLVTCQLSVYSSDKRVSFESKEQEMMDFESSNLNGILWLPDAQAEGFLALTNAATNKVKVQLTIGSRAKELSLYPRETQLVKLHEELERRGPVATLIRLQHDGKPGAILTTGFVLDLKKGYSGSFAMLDPKLMRSSILAGAHIRFGRPDPGEGFPEGTQFRSPLLLANVSDKPLNAQVSVDYTIEDRTKQSKARSSDNDQDEKTGAAKEPDSDTNKFSHVAVKDLTIAPGGVQRIELSDEMARFDIDGPVKEAGVDIAYDAAPGSLIGELTSVDQSGDYSFEVPIKDPSAIGEWPQGLYPWTLADGVMTSLHLKNVTDKSQIADMAVFFSGGTYVPKAIKLAPYQTMAIDIRKLKDSHTPDERGQAIPADVTHGQIWWGERNLRSIIGRAEEVNLREGIASSFSCILPCCRPTSSSFRMSGPATIAVNSVAAFTAQEDDQGCYYGNRNWDSGWYSTTYYLGSSNTSIATVTGTEYTSSINVTAEGAGQATLTGTFGIFYLEFIDTDENGRYFCNIDNGNTDYVYAQLNVKPTISGPNTIWYFNGLSPSGYATSITLTSDGGASTTWRVTAGANKVNLSSTSGAQITITSSGSAFSSSVGDISIVATVGGVDSAPFTLTTRRPASFHPGAVDTSCSSTWGYTTLVYYQVWDTHTDPLPVDTVVNENWTTGIIPDYSGTTWRRLPPGYDTTNASQGAAFADTIDGEDSSHNTPLANCTGSDTPVQHWGQEWRLGSTTSGTGPRVQTDSLQKDIKRAYHSSIVTGSAAW
jgi:hypothetical protein